MSTYYVYAYLDNRKPGSYTYGDLTFPYEPFYIGKGTGPRYKCHLTEAMTLNGRGKNPMKVAVINKVIKETGDAPSVVFLLTELTGKVAIQQEQRIIKLIGRRNNKSGPLTNLTDGGIGMLGYKQTDEQRRNIAEALRGKPKTKEHITAMIRARKFRRHRWVVISPDGKRHTISRLEVFCNKRGLSYREMMKIANRTEETKHIHRGTQHKGWRCKKAKA